jgi:hypothetical protein
MRESRKEAQMEQPTREDAIRYGHALAEVMQMPIYVYVPRDRRRPYGVTPDERLALERAGAGGYIRCEPAEMRATGMEE